MKILVFVLFASLTVPAMASSSEVVCSYAPSQSNAVAAISAAAGGVGATAGAVAAATGLTVVVHSSGALILTGASGYIAGTLGGVATAVAAAPIVVAVGLVVGGSAVTLELVCASKNHPDQVAKIERAASDFAQRFAGAMKKTTIVAGRLKSSIAPVAGRTGVQVRRVATNVWGYAYRKSELVRVELGG